MSQLKVPLLLFALAAGVGCAAHEVPSASFAPPTGEIEIAVENATASSVRVFALYGGDETLLGRVDALSERSLRLPRLASGAIRLVARPSVDVGLQRRHVTEPIQVLGGHRIAWRLHGSPGVSGLPSTSTVRVVACPSDSSC